MGSIFLHLATCRLWAGLVVVGLFGAAGGGCATVRVTDPARTATEQFLLTGAAKLAIEQLSMDGLRDQLAFVDTSYLAPPVQPYFSAGQIPALEELYAVAELRARLLQEGVRLTDKREEATVIVEMRSGGIGIDRYDYLLGIPQFAVPSAGAAGGAAAAASATLVTPEIAILKSIKQRGFASIAISAYRREGGALIAQSGPFVGRTLREDSWIFGYGPNTKGNIPPAEK